MHRSAFATMHHPPLTHATVIEKLAIAPGMIVVDVGAGGSGHISIPIARHLAHGALVACDIEPTRLAILAHRARMHAAHNLITHHGDVERMRGVPVQDEVADALLCINVLHQLEDIPMALSECARMLAPRGKALLVDWDATRAQPAAALAHRLIAPATLRARLKQSTLTHIDTFRIKPYYWGMLVQK